MLALCQQPTRSMPPPMPQSYPLFCLSSNQTFLLLSFCQPRRWLRHSLAKFVPRAAPFDERGFCIPLPRTGKYAETAASGVQSIVRTSGASERACIARCAIRAGRKQGFAGTIPHGWDLSMGTISQRSIALKNQRSLCTSAAATVHGHHENALNRAQSSSPAN